MAIPRYFIMCMGYLSFALLLGFLLRRSGLAIFFYTCYIIFMETLLKLLLRSEVVKNDSVNFLPLNAIEDLMPNPLYKFAEYIPKSSLDFDFLLSNKEAMVSSSIYVLIFLAIAYWNFMKRDI